MGYDAQYDALPDVDTSFDPPFPDAEPYNKAQDDADDAEHKRFIEGDEPEDGGYKYASYNNAGEPTDASSYSPEMPASLNEDGELPPYSIYARYWPVPDEKKDRKPLHYQKLACGHKLRGDGFEPNHRNCERCWFTFFQISGPFTQSVEEAYQAGGPELIVRLKGKIFLHNFLKFMSTVALIKSQQEAAKKNEGSKESEVR